MIDTIEYRKLDGWSKDRKKGSSRYERIPVDIIDEIYIDNKWDFTKLIPQNMPENFTSKDFKKLSALNLKKAQTAINVLQYIGIIKQIGKAGRLHLYEEQADYVTF